MSSPALTPTPAPTPTASKRIGKRSFWLMITGFVLNPLAFLAWTIGGIQAPGSSPQTVAFVFGVFLQVGAIACLGAGTLIGIIALVKKQRPALWPVLAVLGIPMTMFVGAILLIIVWILFGQV